MASDPTKPLLRLMPAQNDARLTGRQRTIPRPEAFSAAQQSERFGPRFDRLRQTLEQNPDGLALRNDPTSLAPERLIVFELRGSIQNFANAIRRIQGLELIDEEELTADETDKAPALYLLLPNVAAFGQILSLWNRWQNGQDLGDGLTPWRDVFATLRDMRPWGPNDRISPEERSFLQEEVDDRADDELISLEIELVFRANEARGATAQATVTAAVAHAGGAVIRTARIADIAYHALLVRMPVPAIRAVIEQNADSLVGVDEIMHIRPQSLAPSLEIGDSIATAPPAGAAPDASPILALIDGAPIAGHPLLAGRLNVDDQFGLEAGVLVEQRRHGTAMASTIIHGDRNRAETPLPRRIHMVPIMNWDGMDERFPSDQLVIDLIYQAVVRMRDGADATAPGVLIINLSLGNLRRPFHGQMSAWARLLDRLAWRFGILFIVSAGNHPYGFDIEAFRTSVEFEDAEADVRATETIRSLARVMAERRLISPAETINGVTVGASNIDAVPDAERVTARTNVNPFANLLTANPSSRLGPGFSRSIKPDLLMPGSREHLRTVNSGTKITVEPSRAGRAFGIKVAAPPTGLLANAETYIGGTSPAAALASRTCHRIYDALEQTYGAAFTGLSHRERAVVLKALLIHPARWPDTAAALIGELLGPHGQGKAPQRKDNIRRFMGYGTFEADDAIACAEDRATYWASGTLSTLQKTHVDFPVPVCIHGQARVHAVSATLAWFTPVQPGRQSYRSVRLLLGDPDHQEDLRIKGAPDQPDHNQVKRGTVTSRRWSGDKAPVVNDGMNVRIIIQREPDAGPTIDDPVPFGLAVTLTMPGIVELYTQSRVRLGGRIRP